MRAMHAACAIFALFLPSASVADITAILVDPNALPYGLGPSAYSNSPDKYSNSPTKYDNSETKYSNSPTKYENSPSNYANRVGGGRNLVTEDGVALGYYVFGDGGIINFFNYKSRRIAYLPGGGDTQSLFFDGGWCGTLGEIRGVTHLGLTQSCYYAFLLQN